MKRLFGRRYFWVDHDCSFYKAVSRNFCDEFDEENYNLLDDIIEKYSTHDYAIDVRSMTSEIIKGLIK